MPKMRENVSIFFFIHPIENGLKSLCFFSFLHITQLRPPLVTFKTFVIFFYFNLTISKILLA